VTDREVLLGCAQVRIKCAEKTKCWSVGTDYILEKLPDISGPGLVEAGRYIVLRPSLGLVHRASPPPLLAPLQHVVLQLHVQRQ